MIDALLNVVPPPDHPFEAYAAPWEQIEQAIGTVLPQDYKEFVRQYGCGYFMKFLKIYVPVSEYKYRRIIPHIRDIEYYIGPIEGSGYVCWPNPGGLIPFGQTDNGDRLFWLAQGAPDDWPVIVWDRGDQKFERFDCDMTTFLAGLASDEILPVGFPGDLFPCTLFAPSTPRVPPKPSWQIKLSLRLAAPAIW